MPQTQISPIVAWCEKGFCDTRPPFVQVVLTAILHEVTELKAGAQVPFASSCMVSCIHGMVQGRRRHHPEKNL